MPRKFKHKYNIQSDIELTDLEVEAYAFSVDLRPEKGGLGRYQHFNRYAFPIWKGVERNDWLDLALLSLCNDEYAVRSGNSTFRSVNWTGCAAAGKTFASAFYALAWWFARPQESIAILCSTTIGSLRRRVWPVLSSLHRQLGQGRMIDSKSMIQYEKGDDKHAIFAMAVAQGETAKALENLKGMHAQRILLIIDEAVGTPQAIFEVVNNQRKGCRDYTVLTIANAVSHFDSHGRCCEPKSGWNSVTVDDEVWPTKGVPEWGIEPGVCIHFDGKNSPNVTARKTVFPFLYRYEDWLKAERSDVATSASHWSQDRGFWVPEGFSNTVFSEPLIDRVDAQGQLSFISRRTPIAFLDPAFGGDKCILQFAVMGDLPSGKAGIQLTEFFEIEGRMDSPKELEFQIADEVMEKCRSRGVKPSHFGCDSSGTGRGAASVLAELWGPIIKTEFGGKASDMPVSEDDPRPGFELYENRVTELWWSARKFLEPGQLKGLYREAIIEFCARTYIYQSRKYRVTPKTDCKALFGRSPDHADAIVGVVEVARQLGAFAGITAAIPNQVAISRQLDSIHWQPNIYDREDQPEETSEEVEFATSPNWGWNAPDFSFSPSED